MSRCLACNARRGFGMWRLCSACQPAPFWAHLPIIRSLPWVRRRWF